MHTFVHFTIYSCFDLVRFHVILYSITYVNFCSVLSRLDHLLYSKNEIQMTQRRLREFSTVIFIYDYTPRFRAIVQIFYCCPILYDCLCRQHVSTAKHKW